jgi:hypothetical protein
MRFPHTLSLLVLGIMSMPCTMYHCRLYKTPDLPIPFSLSMPLSLSCLVLVSLSLSLFSCFVVVFLSSSFFVSYGAPHTHTVPLSMASSGAPFSDCVLWVSSVARLVGLLQLISYGFSHSSPWKDSSFLI